MTTYNVYFSEGRKVAAVYYADGSAHGFNGSVFADTAQGCMEEQQRKMSVYGWAGDVIVRNATQPGHPVLLRA